MMEFIAVAAGIIAGMAAAGTMTAFAMKYAEES